MKWYIAYTEDLNYSFIVYNFFSFIIYAVSIEVLTAQPHRWQTLCQKTLLSSHVWPMLPLTHQKYWSCYCFDFVPTSPHFLLHFHWAYTLQNVRMVWRCEKIWFLLCLCSWGRIGKFLRIRDRKWGLVCYRIASSLGVPKSHAKQ